MYIKSTCPNRDFWKCTEMVAVERAERELCECGKETKEKIKIAF